MLREVKDDYGTDEYCTCETHDYEERICPSEVELFGETDPDNKVCSCCPYCEYQCGLNI